jgi:hypothetical protein
LFRCNSVYHSAIIIEGSVLRKERIPSVNE